VHVGAVRFERETAEEVAFRDDGRGGGNVTDEAGN
jgi:hypothetical protein